MNQATESNKTTEVIKFDRAIDTLLALELLSPKVGIKGARCLSEALDIQIMSYNEKTGKWTEVLYEDYNNLLNYYSNAGTYRKFEIQYPEIVIIG